MGYLLWGSEYCDLPNIRSQSGKNSVTSLTVLKLAQPGDLILIKTPGTGFAFGRRITRNHYDHVAVVMHNNETLNIVMPKTIKLPLSVFNKPENAPLILRPNWTTQEQRDEFIKEMQGYLGKTYDVTKTLLGIFLTCLSTWAGIRIRMKKSKDSASKWICTEAILLSLFKTFPDFRVITKMKLGYNILGFATTNDFLRICKRFSNLLRIEGTN